MNQPFAIRVSAPMQPIKKGRLKRSVASLKKRIKKERNPGRRHWLKVIKKELSTLIETL